jgi:hypothetical protein
MLGNCRAYAVDAQVILAPAVWEELPEKGVAGRPRPACSIMLPRWPRVLKVMA